MRSPIEELAYRLVIDPVRWPAMRRDPSGRRVRDKSQPRDVMREMQTCRMALADPELTPFHPILARELERLEAGERALCARLDIPIDLPEQERWAMIGSRLAAGQDEFGGGRRGRGRPKKAASPSRGELLAELVDEIKSKPEAAGETTIDIIKGFKEANPGRPLFALPAETLAKRVSEAQRPHKKGKPLPK